MVQRADGNVQWQPGDDSTTLASPDAAALASSSENEDDASAVGGAELDMFRVNGKLQYGEHFLLVGSTPALGSWDPARGVRLRWTGCDVWQTSALLPRAAAAEYKLVRCSEDGTPLGDWLPAGQDNNLQLAPLAGVHASAATARPVSRHVNATLPDGWWQPWWWASELGTADALVFLPDFAPVASVARAPTTADLSSAAAPPDLQLTEAQRQAALADASALAAAREQSTDGLSVLSGLARAAGSNAQLGAAAVKAASQGQKTFDVRSPEFARTAAAGAGVAGVATAAAAGIGGGDAAMMAALPVAEAAALGMLVAFGAKNLLFAEDRQKFMEATGSRAKLLKLLKDNMEAVGVAGNADVAAAVSKSAAEAGFIFDPLELISADEEGDWSNNTDDRAPGLKMPTALTENDVKEVASNGDASLN